MGQHCGGGVHHHRAIHRFCQHLLRLAGLWGGCHRRGDQQRLLHAHLVGHWRDAGALRRPRHGRCGLVGRYWSCGGRRWKVLNLSRMGGKSGLWKDGDYLNGRSCTVG